MTDKSEKFRDIPAIRGMLANPMRTSREIENIKDRLQQAPDYSQLSQSINDNLKISTDRYSDMLSGAILNNQRDYQDLAYNIDNLNDTYQDIGFEMQMRMEDEINEIRGMKKQMQVANNLSKKKLEAFEKRNKTMDSIDQSGKETNTILKDTNFGLEDMKFKLSNELIRTQEYISEMNSSQNRIGEVSYGTRIPENKKIVELIKKTDFEGKKTLLALHAKGLVSDGAYSSYPLHGIFSPYFLKHLNNQLTSEQVRTIRGEEKKQIAQLEEEYTDQFNTLKKQNRSEGNILEELAPLQKNISGLIQILPTDDEIDLLNVYHEAKAAEDVIDLIHMGFIDDATLENLIRNYKVDGQVALQIARIMKMDENGINPKTDLDGDVGRRQQLKAQTIQGNIALKQRQEMVRSFEMGNKLLATGNDLIETGNDLIETGNDLKIITNNILLEMKSELSNALSNIGDVLQNIGDSLTYGFNQIAGELQNIRQVNQNIFEELQLQTLLLEDIKNTLLNPLDTKANEFYKQGVYWTEIKNRHNAFNNFKKGLDEKDNHLGNLYGAGTAKMLLGEDKSAAKYLLGTYQVAKKEAKLEIVSQVALDLAKINTKYLRLKLAKRRLNESIRNNQKNIEALLLKARITKILGEKQEFVQLIQIILNEILYENNDNTTIPENYKDIFKYFHTPIDIITDEEIKGGGTSKLIKILPKVEKIGYKEGTKKILGEVLMKNPMALKKSGITTQHIIQIDKNFFNKKYKEIAVKNYSGAKSTDLFALAYIGYQFIDFATIKQIIKTGLEFDIDYINLKNERDIQKKKIYLKNIKDKIYAFGDNAKYMLRDYLATNPGSLLNI